MARTVLSLTIAFSGVAIVLATRIYHFLDSPQWTESQAMRELWWLYLLGAGMMFVGTVAGLDRETG